MSQRAKAPCGCVSRLRVESAGGDTNSNCHSFTGGLQPNDRRRLRNPAVVLVLWDNFFATNPKAVTVAQQLVTDLVRGPFMNGLVQYGIGDGSLAGTIPLDTGNHPAPATWDSGADDDKNQVSQWLKDNANTLSPKPAQDEASLIFLILLPTSTALTNGKNSDGSPNTNICGWHKHQKFNSSSANDDLFWAIIRTDGADGSSAQNFVNSVAFCVGHELAEAFTDRDGGGFVGSNGCEIGDICETKTFFNYRGWNMEQYWSNWDSNCIHGDQPISMKKYLGLIGVDGRQGLRQLKLSTINRNSLAGAVP
jgi:hypothetical protein